jgi:hypothetical protein
MSLRRTKVEVRLFPTVVSAFRRDPTIRMRSMRGLAPSARLGSSIVRLPETFCLRMTRHRESPIAVFWARGGCSSCSRRGEVFVIQLQVRGRWLATA